MDSTNNDVIDIHLPVGNSYIPLLSIPRSDIERLAIRPLKWLLFVVFAICGAHGHLSETPFGESVDPGGTSLVRNRYYYNPSEEYVFVDCDGLGERKSSSSMTTCRANFRNEALQRDEVCVVTETEASICEAAHLIPRCKGEKYIRRVLRIRSRCYGLRDTPAFSIDDHVNGMLLRSDLHGMLHAGKIAFIKTPNFALEPADLQRVERGPERTEYITLHQLRPIRFDKAAIERTLNITPPGQLHPEIAFALGLNIDALFPRATVIPSSPSKQPPTIQSSRSHTFQGSPSPVIEHPGLSGLGTDGILSGDVPGDISTPSSESLVLQLEAPPPIILDFMYGVAAYRQWGRKDIHDIMRKYCEEHYNEATESSDGDCPTARHRARRPGLRSSTGREETTLGRTMAEMSLVLQFLSGISPQEAAMRQEKERQEEERAEQEASRSKVSEWRETVVCLQ